MAALATLAVSGCQKPWVWTKAGATQQDYDTDLFNCEKQRHESGFSGLASNRPPEAPRRSRYLDNCMATRGWGPTRVAE